MTGQDEAVALLRGEGWNVEPTCPYCAAPRKATARTCPLSTCRKKAWMASLTPEQLESYRESVRQKARLQPTRVLTADQKRAKSEREAERAKWKKVHRLYLLLLRQRGLL